MENGIVSTYLRREDGAERAWVPQPDSASMHLHDQMQRAQGCTLSSSEQEFPKPLVQ